MTKLCLFCSKDISSMHRNRKYCSDKCVNKSRYEKHGYRSTQEQRSQWYENRKKAPGYIDKLREQGTARAKKVREFINNYKLEHGCKDCGYNEHYVALDFDHVEGEKELNVSSSKSINQAKKEIEKCEVVCANCHRIRTYNRLYPCKPDIFALTYEEVKDYDFGNHQYREE